AKLSDEAIQVVSQLNPWWSSDPPVVRPTPPVFRRPLISEISQRMRRSKGLIEVVRGPRQVGKTTGIYQIIQDLLAAKTPPNNILFIRFDLELLREEPASLRHTLEWFVDTIRKKPLNEGPPAYLFLDE